LKENILSAISRHIGIFNHQKLKMDFYQPRRIGHDKVSAAIRIQHPAQRPISLVFKFHLDRRGEWKVYDVSIDGLSAISYYRDYYRQAVNQYGTHAFLR
jgi:ABC-type transporter MlaC component